MTSIMNRLSLLLIWSLFFSAVTAKKSLRGIGLGLTEAPTESAAVVVDEPTKVQDDSTDDVVATDDSTDVVVTDDSTDDSTDDVVVATDDSTDDVVVATDDSTDDVVVATDDSTDDVVVATDDSTDDVVVATDDSTDDVVVATDDSTDDVVVATDDSTDDSLPDIANLGMATPDLAITVEIVSLAGLGEALMLPGPFTVFAPSNAAWTEVITNIEEIEAIPGDLLNAILAYHVVGGTVLASDITDGLVLTTLMGETIEFGVDGDVVTVNEEVISMTDMMASNGVVHVIDGVMFPQAVLAPVEDDSTDDSVDDAVSDSVDDAIEDVSPELGIADVAFMDPDLSIMIQLVALAGLGDALTLPGPFTVFAPTNAAWTEVITDLTSLESLDPTVLSAILAYHVVFGTYEASDITDGLILTTLMGESIEFGIDDEGVVTVNEEIISMTDISASNGIIHKIDGVMFPQAVLGPETEGRLLGFVRK
eukprot:CAMPEP_0201137166 /NCGR_PEP_ID=MMETSP0850-20130426/55267_1 /ASSEMBLY_ACC=CAM_ASM_000622 /TAXON_ID=183588 /ORGANISM="Pseudo-nitzschia fraudulenta, Strain WWA7" /LENGTH=478 /DNA_ID=CAMNT_0047408507 /DNA_START=109 /DNA_END=1545 /DNA_ORIENTATION=-